MKSFLNNYLIVGFVIIFVLVPLSNQTLLIASPAINPFDESKISYSYANIGNIPYGKTLTFDLVENDTLDLCKPVSDEEKNHFLTATYLLIDTTVGTCSYTTQAIAAQELGAKGVIFVSDLVNYYEKIVQVDDGNGRKVHITVLFIDSQTYRKLQTLENIHIKVSFETHLTQVANITYFLSASGRSNYIFLRQFQPYFEKIKDYIYFKPVYFTTKCPNCNEKEDCLISSDYCTFQMDEYKNDMGKYILKEQLKQYSLWKEKETDKYFQYMNLFDQFCTVDWRNSDQCGNNILKQIGVDNLKLNEAPTLLMDEWRIQQVSSGFLTTPQMTLNHELYAGSYDPQQIFTAVCSSLINPPSECTGQIPHPALKIGWIIGSIIIALLISLIIGFAIYKKCVKKEMTEEIYSKVNELVAMYATEVQQHTKKGKDRLKMRLNEQL